MPAGAAASGGAQIGLQSEVLAEAARCIEAEMPWYEKLGLRYQEAANGGGDVAVEAVLAFNVVSGLINAANKTVLAPVFVVLKGLLGAVHGAAAAKEEIVELIRYCVGISRCLLDAAKVEDMPSSMAATLGEFKGEMEAVGEFVHAYTTRSSGFLRKTGLSSRDRGTAAGHKKKLKDLLDAVLGDLALQTNLGLNEIKDMIEARDPPSLGALADIPREAPMLPTTYVQRTAMSEGVIADLTDSQRSASTTHCLLGMGGGGKTLIASSVVRDERVRASFKNGIFWISVGREGKNVALLLEHLAVNLARVPTDRPHRCPDRFDGAEEALRHLAAVRTKNGLRCLVVLDNVWNVDVVNAFASTGFHVLVTTRQSTVVSPVHSGLCTEVGDMSEERALEVLGKASQARGPLPAEEARKVAHDCGMLPLALGMVGTLAKDQPLDPASWRTVHEKLQAKHTKFLKIDNAKLFYAIDISLHDLPSTQQEQLQLMAVLASGVVATSEMLANLWNKDISDVKAGASALVHRCLLQGMREGYRLHDLVLEYLQLIIAMDDGRLAKTASSRQARYLARLGVFKQYHDRGTEVSSSGLYTLVALWNSVKRLDGAVNVEVWYRKSLDGVTEIRIATQVAWLLSLLGSYAGAEATLRSSLTGADERNDQLVEVGYALGVLVGALKDQGKYAEADPLSLRVIGILEKALGPGHPNVAVSLEHRALLLAEQRKFDGADRLYLRSIEIGERSFGSDHPQLGQSLNNRADLLRGQGKLDEADALLVRAIKIQEKGFSSNHPILATTLGTRATVLGAQGNFDEADRLHRRCIEIQENTLGPDHPEIAAGFNNRADLLRRQGKLEEADPLYVRAIEILEAALVPDHPNIALSLASRAVGLRAQGKFDEADPLLLRATEIAENAHCPDYPHLSNILDIRTTILLAQRRYGEADTLCKRCIDIKEKALGPDHPELAETLKRAACFLAQSKPDEADVVVQRAIGINERALGPDHPSLTASLGIRAVVLRAQGKYDEADHLYLRCIEIKERTLGPDHPELAASLQNRADLLQAQGKLDEADPLLERAIEIQERALGPDHPSLATSLDTRALVLQAQGKYFEADRLYLRCIEVQENSLGLDHPDVAASLSKRALALKAQGKLDDADPLYVRAVEIVRKALGPDHPSLGNSLGNRAILLGEQGKYAEADRLSFECVEIFEKTFRPDHPSLVRSFDVGAWLLHEQGKLEEADQIYLKLLLIQEEALGPDHPSLAETLNKRARFLQLQGKCEEADPLYLRAVDILERTLGHDHPFLAQTLHIRAGLLQAQGNHGEARPLFETALAIRREKLGEGHQDTVLTLNALNELHQRNHMQVPGTE